MITAPAPVEASLVDYGEGVYGFTHLAMSDDGQDSSPLGRALAVFLQEHPNIEITAVIRDDGEYLIVTRTESDL